jgi:transposase InsO family protein
VVGALGGQDLLARRTLIMSRKAKHKRTKQGRGTVSPRARRFSEAQRTKALELCASGLTRKKVAEMVGTTTESLRRWGHLAAASAGEAPTATLVAGNVEKRSKGTVVREGGLAPVEVEAILKLKKQHPSMGPAQLRAQLKRFRGWRISVKAIASVLRRNGYRLVHTGSRPEGDEHPQRFEAPRRNAIWQIDFAEVRVGPERRFLLFLLDDYSRYIVGAALCEAPSSEAVVGELKRAIARHGKPESVYTDRGGAFLAWRDPSDFARFCETELIDHHVSRSYRPQGRGKVEALIGTMQRELWQVQHFCSVAEAEQQLADWVERYNEHRAHMGIDGLTPADRFFARANKVRAALEARIRQRTAAPEPAGAPLEEAAAASPLEVLRVVMVDGNAELRVFGARVRLGAIN